MSQKAGRHVDPEEQTSAGSAQGGAAPAPGGLDAWEAVLDGISDSVCFLDVDWRFVRANAQAVQLWGKNLRELLGNRIWDLFPELLGAEFEREARGSMQRQKPAAFEYYHPVLGHWYEHRFHPAAGGLLILTASVDERKSLAEQVRRADERYRRLFETTRDGILIVDDSGRYVDVNESFCRIVKTPREELLGSHFSRFIPPGRLDEAERAFADLKSGKATPADFPLLAADGTLVELEWSSSSHYLPGLSFCMCRNVTARRAAERELEESRERLRLAHQAAGGLPWEWNLVTGEVLWSREAYAFLGLPYSGAPVSSETWTSVLHPGDRERVLGVVRAGIECGDVIDTEFRILRADGEPRWVHSRASIFRGADGRAVRMIGLNQDVTSYREAQIALQSSERRFRRIFETAGVSLWEEDFSAVARRLGELRAAGVADLREYLRAHPEFAAEMARLVVIKDVNITTIRMFGAADKNEMLAGLGRIFLPETLEAFGEELVAIWEKRRSYDAETVVQTLAGERRSMIFTMEFGGGERDLDSVLVSLMDITPLKEAAAKVRESEERQRRAVEAGKVGLWEWDIVHNRVTWSDYVYQLQGLEPGTFGGTVEAFASLVHPDDAGRLSAALEKALAGEAGYDIEFRAVRPDGRPAWLATSGKVTFDDSGRPVWMHGAVIDTTERRLAEEALRRTNAELEEFAYVASHDLQEPLRTVNIYTELLLRQPGFAGDAEAIRFGSVIRAGVERMEQLIRGLLAYSRVVHPDQEAPRPADLNRSLERALEALHVRARETGAVVECDRLPRVWGDEAQLAQVLQNLLANAMKYCGEGEEPRVRVAAERIGAEWRITVADRGIGFAPHHAERIFGLFKRLHKEAYPGTGLGLAICKRIVERYGGRIWAASEGEGRGAEFHFTLLGWDG